MLCAAIEQTRVTELVETKYFDQTEKMGFSFPCMPAFLKVSPLKATEEEGVSGSNSAKKERKQEKKEKQQMKQEEEAEKKMSNLDEGAKLTPYFQFHSRPGLL